MSEVWKPNQEFSLDDGLRYVSGEVAAACDVQSYTNNLYKSYIENGRQTSAARLLVNSGAVLRQAEVLQGVEPRQATMLGHALMQGGLFGMRAVELSQFAYLLGELHTYSLTTDYNASHQFSHDAQTVARGQAISASGDHGYQQFAQPIHSELQEWGSELHQNLVLNSVAFKRGVGFMLHATQKVHQNNEDAQFERFMLHEVAVDKLQWLALEEMFPGQE